MAEYDTSGVRRAGYLSLLTAGTSVLGGIGDYFTTRAQAKGVANAYRANARIAERNARAALQDAMAARLSTLRRVDDILMMGRLNRGSMVAATATRGVVADTGSPLEALAAEAYQTGKQAGEEHLSGMLQARELEIEAINYKFQASQNRSAAKMAKRQANVAAITGLTQSLSGAAISFGGFMQSRSLLAQMRPASAPEGASLLWGDQLPFQMPPGE